MEALTLAIEKGLSRCAVAVIKYLQYCLTTLYPTIFLYLLSKPATIILALVAGWRYVDLLTCTIIKLKKVKANAVELAK